MSQQVTINGRMSNIGIDETVRINNKLIGRQPSIINGLIPTDIAINGLARLPVLSSCVLNLPLHHSIYSVAPAKTFKSLDKNAYTCTAIGMLWTPEGGKFDGTDDVINLGDTTTFKFLHGALDTAAFQWTIEVWLRMAVIVGDPNDNYVVLSTGGYVSSANVGIDFAIYYLTGSTGQIGVDIRRGVSGQSVLNYISANGFYPNDGLWHHFVVTYDQALASANMTLIRDGVSIATANKIAFTPSTANSTYALQIGGENNLRTYKGGIGELRIYNAALSLAQAKSQRLATMWRYI